MNPAAPSTDAHSKQPGSGWLVFHGVSEESEVRLRLFCFPYAGSEASIFRLWPMALPSWAQVVAIQLPGRGYRLREPLISDMREIVGAIARELKPLLDLPYIFFGHSMGALVTFEVTRLLGVESPRQPELLIVSGRNAPQFRSRDRRFALLTDEGLVSAVREYHGTPEAFLENAELRALWLPRFRADLTASVLYEYVPGPPLTCPILVTYGEQDALVNEPGLRGWAEQSSAAVRLMGYPGAHFFLHSAEALLLTTIRAELMARTKSTI